MIILPGTVEVRPCFLCGMLGPCQHRESRVEAAYASVRRKRPHRCVSWHEGTARIKVPRHRERIGPHWATPLIAALRLRGAA